MFWFSDCKFQISDARRVAYNFIFQHTCRDISMSEFRCVACWYSDALVQTIVVVVHQIFHVRRLIVGFRCLSCRAMFLEPGCIWSANQLRMSLDGTRPECKNKHHLWCAALRAEGNCLQHVALAIHGSTWQFLLHAMSNWYFRLVTEFSILGSCISCCSNT